MSNSAIYNNTYDCYCNDGFFFFFTAMPKMWKREHWTIYKQMCWRLTRNCTATRTNLFEPPQYFSFASWHFTAETGQRIFSTVQRFTHRWHRCPFKHVPFFWCVFRLFMYIFQVQQWVCLFAVIRFWLKKELTLVWLELCSCSLWFHSTSELYTLHLKTGFEKFFHRFDGINKH